MRRSYALLVAFVCALSLSARAQYVVTFPITDHDWVVRYSSNQYGLLQQTYLRGKIAYQTETTLYFGSHSRTFHTTVWPLLAAFIAVLLPIAWLITYGIGSLATPAKKHPPPSTKSPD
jgi:hypothetical protein